MELISRRMGEEPSAAGQWYVVRVRSDAAIALIGVEKAGLAGYLPVELVRVTYRGTHRGRSETQWRALFPRHMFVAFDPGRDLRRLCEIHGVDDVLKRDGKPVSVCGDLVKALRSAERRGLFDLAGASRLPDDTPPPDVRYAGLVARLKRERSSKARAKLLMELLIGKGQI
jgi:hypothetical protein